MTPEWLAKNGFWGGLVWGGVSRKNFGGYFFDFWEARR
jgi:hypothetical protein